MPNYRIKISAIVSEVIEFDAENEENAINHAYDRSLDSLRIQDFVVEVLDSSDEKESEQAELGQEGHQQCRKP